jgi:GT2 family glycosyltransferase
MYDHMRSLYECWPHPNKEVYIVPNLDFRLSVSGALNKGFRWALRDGCDYIVYAADDVIIKGDDIERLLTTLIEEDKWVVSLQLGGLAFFAINPVVFDEVGYWDEGFYPAYFEDNDWYYRIKLKDPNRYKEIPGQSVHLESVTLKRMSPHEVEKHHINFRRNRDRYIAKWGGEPYHETFTVPWNGAEPPGWAVGDTA